jgi:hypothetical protein
VRSICSGAWLTPRYFYESFDDLDALLVAIVDSVAAEVAQRGIDAIVTAASDLTAQVRAVVDAGHRVLVIGARRMRCSSRVLGMVRCGTVGRRSS